MPKFGHQDLQDVMEVRRLEQRLGELKSRQFSLWADVECEWKTNEEITPEWDEIQREIDEIERQLSQ